jgi:hypothetical protein
LTYLQMHYNQECKEQLTWNQIELRMRRTSALEQLIQQFGLPITIRSRLWMRMCDSEAFKSASKWTFERLCSASTKMPVLKKRQVARVLPNNACFSRFNSTGVQRLRKLLRLMRWLQRDQLNISWFDDHLGWSAEKDNNNIDRPKCNEKEADDWTETLTESDCNVARSDSIERWRIELNVPLIAAYLLLITDEQDAFWLLLSIVNEAESGCSMTDARCKENDDQRESLLSRLIREHCPHVFDHLQSLQVDIWLICNPWIVSLFAGWLSNTGLLYRLWDLHFYYGIVVHYQLLIGLLKQNETQLLQSTETKQAIEVLGRLPETIVSETHLIDCWLLGKQRLLALPHKLNFGRTSNNEIKSIASADFGSFGGCANDSLSLLDSTLLHQWNESPCAGQALRTALRSARLRNGTAASRARPDQLKVKNVRQTTILMELQETIEAVVCHFTLQHSHLQIDLTLRDDSAPSSPDRLLSSMSATISNDTNNNRVAVDEESRDEPISLRQMLCTFSRKVDQLGASQRRLNSNVCPSESAAESNRRDSSGGARCHSDNRIKAISLIAFKSEQPDELHFKAGQIVRLLDERDEHCWIGQIGQRVGWFPAKFVRVLDETNGEYMAAGDDSVDTLINNLIRGRLGSVIKCVLTHGLRKGLGLFTVHPWMLVEETAERLRVQHSRSVANGNAHRSKHALSRTYRLPDSQATVDEPEATFVEAVEQINRSHGNVPMDVRMRSWICLALNRQQLHQWFAFYCECDTTLMSKHYHRWSYITSPASKLIKAHLR